MRSKPPNRIFAHISQKLIDTHYEKQNPNVLIKFLDHQRNISIKNRNFWFILCVCIAMKASKLDDKYLNKLKLIQARVSFVNFIMLTYK